MFGGETIPNDSFVDLDDIFGIGGGASPSNANSNGTLLCVTDLEDCCAAPPRGDWYFPNGHVVMTNINILKYNVTFRVNRGPSEVQRGIYGSVRLWRRWSDVPGRGRFRCELPSAADPSVNQTLYANICEFCFTFCV